MDSRFHKLAKLLVNHSCQLQPGENVLIQAAGAPERFLEALIEAVCEVGGIPHLSIGSPRVSRKLVNSADAGAMKAIGDLEAHRMSKM